MRSNDGSSGFSRLEVLVAFLILSAALVAANQSLSYTLRSFAAASSSRDADRAAEEIFAEFLLATKRHERQTAGEKHGLKWRLRRDVLALAADNETTAEKLTLEIAPASDDQVSRRYVTYRVIDIHGVQNAR